VAELTQVVSLADVRTYLRYPAADTSDDDALANLFIPACTDAMTDLCGEICPVQYDEYYDGGDCSIWLRHVPVLSVQNVNEGWGWIDYDLDYVQVNTVPATSLFAYSLDDNETGEISRRSAGNVNIPFMPGSDNIRVTYTGGRPGTPGGVYLAALELIRHWWAGSQQRSSGEADTYDETAEDFTRSTGVTGINFGVPYAIVAMVRGQRKAPVIG
jgi:hypothetical protein